MWLPGIEQGAAGTLYFGQNNVGLGNYNGGVGVVYLLENPANSFVPNATRFANLQDEVTYMRIVGPLRFAMYNNNTASPYDYVLSYGLVLVKGEYDGSGNWTVASSDIPNPSKANGARDNPERWLYKTQCVLTQKLGNITAGGAIYSEARAEAMSTDVLGLTNIDLKPKRKAHYEEKLAVVATCETTDPSAGTPLSIDIIMNEHLRVLTAKWS